MSRVGNTKGFTLIELMLAMAFLSALLLGIAMTIITIGTIYNKGMTVKDISQSARALNSDITRVASESASFDASTDLLTTTAGGRLCLGQYSYIWNTAAAQKSNDAALMKVRNNIDLRVNFVKIPDATKAYCLTTTRDISPTDGRLMQEMLPAGDHTISVMNVSIPPSSVVKDDTMNQSLVTLNYTIGSGDIRAMNATQTACLDPSDPNSDITYCTVQDFSLVLRVGNKVN